MPTLDAFLTRKLHVPAPPVAERLIDALELTDHRYDCLAWARLLLFLDRDEYREPDPPATSTRALPGTSAKVDVLAARADRGEGLWHEADATPRAFDLAEAGGGLADGGGAREPPSPSQKNSQKKNLQLYLTLPPPDRIVQVYSMRVHAAPAKRGDPAGENNGLHHHAAEGVGRLGLR